MKKKAKRAVKRGSLGIRGTVELEGRSLLPADLPLFAYAVDKVGQVVASSQIKSDGQFQLSTAQADGQLDLVLSHAADQRRAIANPLHRQHIEAEQLELAASEGLEKNIFVAEVIWKPWWPRQICINGHVRKIPNCPIPFAKVEIFDVDRELCLWPWFERFKDLVLKERVIRVEDIQRKIPELDLARLDSAFVDTSGVAQALSVDNDAEPVRNLSGGDLQLQPLSISNLPTTLADSQPTMTSRLAPWVLFPNCHYSKQLICTTETDQNGYFNCCFTWFPLQFKNGRFTFDYRPDIILRVTQIIDGVPKVIYMDAYASTRWNSNGAHVDLFLDDPDIQCGDGGSQTRPEGSVAFFTRIGNHEVYKINQTDGTYNALLASQNNWAYGHALRIFAQFGDTLSQLQNISGAKKPYFYKILVNGEPVTTPLKDTRVHKGTLFSESHVLGPQVRESVAHGKQTALYEIRNFKDFYWYNPDWIANWITATTSGATVTKLVSDGIKTLELEVYDDNAQLLDNTKVNYLDGTVAPPAVLPSKYPCTMKVAIDNNPPAVNMQVNPLPTGCGVIKHTSVPPLTVSVNVSQTNNRVFRWGLSYIKGTDSTPISLAGNTSGSGLAHTVLANPAVNPVNANAMLSGLTTTCAFSLTLRAEAHITNGYSQIYDREVKQAIAIEKCS